jgi:hypothetical protein
VDQKTFNERCLAVVIVEREPVMTDAQIIAAFEKWAGRAPRRADLAVCNILGRSPDSVAEFIWDHCLGEPLVPSIAAIRHSINKESF